MTTVFDKFGQQGRLVNEDRIARHEADTASIALPDGREVRVPAQWLESHAGDYYVPVRLDEIADAQASGAEITQRTIPLVEETLDVQPRKTERVVRVRTVTREHDEIIEQPLLREQAEIKRVRLNRPVPGPVSARQEGDTLIIPLVEEEIVWEKRLVVREEIHVRKRRTQEQNTARVRLRREDVVVERAPERKDK
ncbi:MAG: YsnF/AvaK domain-containing protein [Sulfurifustaceae bacterium]